MQTVTEIFALTACLVKSSSSLFCAVKFTNRHTHHSVVSRIRIWTRRSRRSGTGRGGRGRRRHRSGRRCCRRSSRRGHWLRWGWPSGRSGRRGCRRRHRLRWGRPSGRSGRRRNRRSGRRCRRIRLGRVPHAAGCHSDGADVPHVIRDSARVVIVHRGLETLARFPSHQARRCSDGHADHDQCGHRLHAASSKNPQGSAG